MEGARDVPQYNTPPPPTQLSIYRRGFKTTAFIKGHLIESLLKQESFKYRREIFYTDGVLLAELTIPPYHSDSAYWVI